MPTPASSGFPPHCATKNRPLVRGEKATGRLRSPRRGSRPPSCRKEPNGGRIARRGSAHVKGESVLAAARGVRMDAGPAVAHTPHANGGQTKHRRRAVGLLQRVLAPTAHPESASHHPPPLTRAAHIRQTTSGSDARRARTATPRRAGGPPPLFGSQTVRAPHTQPRMTGAVQPPRNPHRNGPKRRFFFLAASFSSTRRRW